jgi:3-oxoacyl-[acyl-carrier protein] reductase
LALQLARAGAFVAAGDLDMKGLEQLAAECDYLPGRVLTRSSMCRRKAQSGSLLARSASKWGGVNTLVNNAGILRDRLLAKGETGWVKRLPTLQWQQVIDVNLTGFASACG